MLSITGDAVSTVSQDTQERGVQGIAGVVGEHGARWIIRTVKEPAQFQTGLFNQRGAFQPGGWTSAIRTVAVVAKKLVHPSINHFRLGEAGRGVVQIDRLADRFQSCIVRCHGGDYTCRESGAVS